MAEENLQDLSRHPLFIRRSIGTRVEMNSVPPPDIFDYRRLSALRARAASRAASDRFLWRHMADELFERLADVSRNFDDILMVGPIGNFAQLILANRRANVTHLHLSAQTVSEGADNIIAEDRLIASVPGQTDSKAYDLIVSAGTLDSVNDLPGALIQYRRLLRPDGLFLASLFGGGSLSALRAAMIKADGNRISPHIHPQIELRNMADLLVRAGFALPVADIDRIDIRYRDWRSLVGDLRDMGLGNGLSGARHYLGKDYPARLSAAWDAKAGPDGKVTETFRFLQLSGWGPSPTQPKPAARGSGSVSLAAALQPRKRSD